MHSSAVTKAIQLAFLGMGPESDPFVSDLAKLLLLQAPQHSPSAGAPADSAADTRRKQTQKVVGATGLESNASRT